MKEPAEPSIPGCHPREGLQSVMRRTIKLLQSEKVKAASGITICASWVLECHASNKQSAVQRKEAISSLTSILKAAQLQNGCEA